MTDPRARSATRGVLGASGAVLVCAVLLAAFVHGAREELPGPDPLIPVAVALGVLMAVALSLRALDPQRPGFVEALMVAYLGWNLLSIVLVHQYEAVNPTTGIDVDVARLVLSGIVLPFVTYQAARAGLVDERSVRWLLWTVVGMTAYSSWVAIMQFHGPVWLVWPSFVVDAPSWPGRAVGIFDQPVTNGLLLVLGIVVCLMLAERPDTAGCLRIGLCVLTAAAVYSVYLTHTRAAVLGLVAAVVLGVVFARGWRRGFIAIGVLGLAGLASQGAELLSPDREAGGFGSPDEVVDRLNIGTTAVHAIGDHPLLGVGLGRFAMYNTYQHEAWSAQVDWARGQGLIAHENDLAIGADVGLPGLVLWLAILVCIGWRIWRALQDLPADDLLGRPLAVVAGIAVAVMVVNGFTVDLRPLEFTTMLPLALAGASVGELERRRQNGRFVAPPDGARPVMAGPSA